MSERACAKQGGTRTPSRCTIRCLITPLPRLPFNALTFCEHSAGQAPDATQRPTRRSFPAVVTVARRCTATPHSHAVPTCLPGSLQRTSLPPPPLPTQVPASLMEEAERAAKAALEDSDM